MYCPKCNETFEEGSRRFCPADGARLISDSLDVETAGKGIFANLLPKAGPVGAMDEKLDDQPTFTLFEDEPDIPSGTKEPEREADFFQLDDIPAEEPPPPVFTVPPPPVAAKPVGRKVDPSEIPAGHVVLSDSERTASAFETFDTERPEDLVSRTVKGRYRVVEYLGGDESGLAYLADDRIANRPVLVRILLEDESDPIVKSILAEERVALSHFTHPNVARLVDSGAFTNGIQFLITEFAEALSIRDILSIHGYFPPQRTARIIKQAAYALGEAHQQGIIHRDVRPQNLIILNDGENEHLKLVNFGASNGEPNESNAVYKAPEVLDGRTATAASDLYSLAVVAYEMLVGELPFKGETSKEYMRSQYNGPATLPSSAIPELSSAVDDVFEKALSFKASGRFGKAREFGDAIAAALSEPTPATDGSQPAEAPRRTPVVQSKKVAVLKPIDVPERAVPASAEPAWKARSPEPPQEETSRAKLIGAIAIVALLGLVVFGWYYVMNHPSTSVPVGTGVTSGSNEPNVPTIASDVELPPQPRKITQPPNSEYFANSKQNLKGDLLRNFVGFSLYYPKDWKVNGPQEGTVSGSRGKFLDVSRLGPHGGLKEQMLISYYPSKGTFTADASSFEQMVKETNETLRKILPEYQMISEGEIKVNGDWRAYEVKFQSSGQSESGEKLTVWGRRLFVPAARPGTRNGFEITMLATSLADDIRSADDVGVHGELAAILYSFEPSQNF